MPAKGKYLLNDQELKQEALYRKFSGISQYQPLVLLLVVVVGVRCGPSAFQSVKTDSISENIVHAYTTHTLSHTHT